MAQIDLTIDSKVGIGLLMAMLPMLWFAFKIYTKVNWLCVKAERYWTDGKMSIWTKRLRDTNKILKVPSVSDVVEDVEPTPIKKILFMSMLIVAFTGCRTARVEPVMAQPPPAPWQVEAVGDFGFRSIVVEPTTNNHQLITVVLTNVSPGLTYWFEFSPNLLAGFAPYQPTVATDMVHTVTFYTTNAIEDRYYRAYVP